MSADYFDANIAIDLFDETDAQERSDSRMLLGQAMGDGSDVLSFQVVQETLHVVW